MITILIVKGIFCICAGWGFMDMLNTFTDFNFAFKFILLLMFSFVVSISLSL